MRRASAVHKELQAAKDAEGQRNGLPQGGAHQLFMVDQTSVQMHIHM